MATKARAEGDCWTIYFSGRTEPDLRLAKAMLRRVEQTTLGMPDAWFKYRNYFTKTPNIGDEADESQQSGEPSVRVGENVVDLGHGHSITFTGALASFEWLSLSGHTNIRPARLPIEDEAAVEPRNPKAVVTRGQAAKLGSAFSHSHLEHGVSVAGSSTYLRSHILPVHHFSGMARPSALDQELVEGIPALYCLDTVTLFRVLTLFFFVQAPRSRRPRPRR